MQVDSIASATYSDIFRDAIFPYKSVDFNLLNSKKCDKLEFLFFHEEKIKIGVIGGVIGTRFLVPFSAPFSLLSHSNGRIRSEFLIRAISVLDEHLSNSGITDVTFTLPPFFYDESLISKTVFSMYQNGYEIRIDDNHYFNTKDYSKYESETIGRGVRYNLKVGSKAGLTIKKATDVHEKMSAYEIIKQNKESKNRPLKLKFEQLIEMERFLPIDYFLVYLNGQPVSSSIVYIYAGGVVHIIYWGDLPAHSCFYPMNFMAMNIFKYYKERGYSIIDLGNASENTVPNFGLSNFKETIGCTTTIKCTCVKFFNQSK